MAIYRGSGGSTSTTDQATIDQVADDAATATTKAAEAATSATAAASSASSASSSASSASSSASTATTKASEASTSATNAASSATAAASSATSAASSATTASSANTNAQAAKTAAEAAQSAAESAKTAAETAETNTDTLADDVNKMAKNAEDSQYTLSDSTTGYSALHYAAKAASSASTASTAATTATSAASTASAASDAALAALDSFDDRYLGQKTSDPTTDNDGDALVAGALYYNTTDDIMKVYDGSVWVAAYASLSGTLVAANNLSDLASVSAARTNLGLGTAATTASTDYVAVTGDSMTGDLSFGDSVKAQFGASNDLQIYHDGSNSIIRDTGTGSLKLLSDGTGVQLTSTTGENLAHFNVNDACKLFHDNTKTLETTSTGIDVTGVITTDGLTTSADINFGDNDKAIFGASDDLQIYHDGSNSFINDTGTGNLVLRGANVAIQDASANNQVFINNGGSVDLRHAGSAKLATTSTGIDVTGTVTADTDIRVDGASPSLYLMESDTTDLNTRLRTSNGDFIIDTGNDAQSTVTNRFRIDHSTGDISFYEDTGTTAKFFWDASAESLGIGTSSPTRTLDVAGSGGNYAVIRSTGSDSSSNAALLFQNGSTGNATNDGLYIGRTGNGSNWIWTYESEPLIIGTGNSEAMRIDSSRRVGIGTSSPNSPLEVTVASGTSGSTSGIRLISSDGGGYSVYPTSAVANPVWNTNVNSNEQISWSVGGSEAMRIDSSGNLLVGRTDAYASTAASGSGIVLNQSNGQLEVATASVENFFNRTGSDGSIITFRKDGTTVGSIGCASGDLTVVSAGDLKFYTSTSNEDMRLETDGDLHVDGDVIAYSTTISDERLKENIVGIDGALDKVSQLNGYTFTYKADGKISAGVIAQEVEKVLPEAVSEKELPLKADDGEQYKVVNYDALHGLLIEAIKELKAEVADLKSQLEKN